MYLVMFKQSLFCVALFWAVYSLLISMMVQRHKNRSVTVQVKNQISRSFFLPIICLQSAIVLLATIPLMGSLMAMMFGREIDLITLPICLFSGILLAGVSVYVVSTLTIFFCFTACKVQDKLLKGG